MRHLQFFSAEELFQIAEPQVGLGVHVVLGVVQEPVVDLAQALELAPELAGRDGGDGNGPELLGDEAIKISRFLTHSCDLFNS